MGMHYNSSTYIKKIFQVPIPHTYIPNNDSLHKGFTPIDQNLQYSIKCGCSVFVYI